jgi:hypothetical protein
MEANTEPTNITEGLEKENSLAALTKRIEEIAAENKKRAKTLQAIVNDNANPHPAHVALIFALVLAVIWLIYIIFVKPNISGVWIDTKGNKWIIDHSFSSVDVKLITNGKTIKGKAKITDNIFKFKEYTGIWNYNDIVIFIGGGGMERVKN